MEISRLFMGWDGIFDTPMEYLSHMSSLDGVSERKFVVKSRPRVSFKVCKSTQTILNRFPLNIVVLFEIY
jgi:hypothetical protein